MKTSELLLALVGLGVAVFVVLPYMRNVRAIPAPTVPSRPTQKVKAPRQPPAAPPITHVSLQPRMRDYGVCDCVGDILSGPQCKVAGQKCSDIENRFKAGSTCVCGPDGIATGLGCPFIGKSCLEIGHTIKYPAANIPNYSQRQQSFYVGGPMTWQQVLCADSIGPDPMCPGSGFAETVDRSKYVPWQEWMKKMNELDPRCTDIPAKCSENPEYRCKPHNNPEWFKNMPEDTGFTCTNACGETGFCDPKTNMMTAKYYDIPKTLPYANPQTAMERIRNENAMHYEGAQPERFVNPLRSPQTHSPVEDLVSGVGKWLGSLIGSHPVMTGSPASPIAIPQTVPIGWASKKSKAKLPRAGTETCLFDAHTGKIAYCPKTLTAGEKMRLHLGWGWVKKKDVGPLFPRSDSSHPIKLGDWCTTGSPIEVDGIYYCPNYRSDERGKLVTPHRPVAKDEGKLTSLPFTKGKGTTSTPEHLIPHADLYKI